MHDLDFDGYDIDTAFPDDDDDVSFEGFPQESGAAFLSQVGRCFCLVARGALSLLFQAVWMAFPLDQGLQLDSLWSSGDLHFDNSLADHVVSRQLVLDKIVALDFSVWQPL